MLMRTVYPANVDSDHGRTAQCRPPDATSPAALVDQPFESSEMGDSMDADLLPELSGETWVAATLLAELTVDMPPTDEELDLFAASRCKETSTTVRRWVQTGTPPLWLELRCW